MLRDLGIKMNRTYTDFTLYTLFVRNVVPSQELLRLCDLGEGQAQQAMEVDNSDQVNESRIHSRG
jgi:hypothetical protein